MGHSVVAYLQNNSATVTPTVILETLLNVSESTGQAWCLLKKNPFSPSAPRYAYLLYKSFYNGAEFYGCYNRHSGVLYSYRDLHCVGLVDGVLAPNISTLPNSLRLVLIGVSAEVTPEKVIVALCNCTDMVVIMKATM